MTEPNQVERPDLEAWSVLDRGFVTIGDVKKAALYALSLEDKLRAQKEREYAIRLECEKECLVETERLVEQREELWEALAELVEAGTRRANVPWEDLVSEDRQARTKTNAVVIEFVDALDKARALAATPPEPEERNA